MKTAKLCAFLLLLIFSGSLLAVKNNDYVYRSFTIEDGLSQSSVLSILHDSRGYLWFGTVDGLNRFDGYEFKIYRNEVSDSLSISDNGISALFEDKNGVIWIGTIAGSLNRFDKYTETFHRYNISEGRNTPNTERPSDLELNLYYMRKTKYTITSIAEDNYGNLWVGTWDNGIIVLNKNSKTIFNIYNIKNNNNTLNCNQVSDIIIDKKNSVWIGTFGGGLNTLKLDVNYFNQANQNFDLLKLRFETVMCGKNIEVCQCDNFITTLHLDKSGSLWTGTLGGKLSFSENILQSLNPLLNQFELNSKNKSGIVNSAIMDINEDSNGNILAGTFGDGVIVIDKLKNSYDFIKNDPYNKNSLPNNEISSILTDRSGIIWVGTSVSNGICKVMQANLKFNHLTSSPENRNSLNNRTVFSIYEDNKKNLWVGTYSGGVNRIDGITKKVKVFTNGKDNPNSLSDKHIRAISGDPFGNIWIGTFNGGLNRIDTRTEKVYRYSYNKNNPEGIGANQIQSLYIDPDLILWIGTFGGGMNSLDLKAFNGTNPKFKSYKNNPFDNTTISDNKVYSIIEDKTRTIWIGTYGGGLNRFDKKTNKFVSYKHDPADNLSLSDDRVMAVFEDSQCNLWIGTNGGGLNKFNRTTGKFSRFNDRNGLLSNVVYGIIEDENKNLWMSTDNGIFKFEVSTGTFIHYDQQDGLQSREYNGGAYFKNNEGEIFFGGINGLNYFWPANIKKNISIPPVVISKFKVFNTEWKGEFKEIKLSYNQNFISFEFAALDFTNPAGNKYAYKLEGFDNVWHYTDAKYRIANYTYLPHGKYLFRVKGTNNDGVWNEAGTAIDLIIAPPFWLRWWFILLCIIAVAIPAALIMKFRLDKINSIEKLKTKLAADIHDNIGAGLTEISILSELVANDIPENQQNARAKLQYIGHTSRKLVDDLSDIVWVINPNQDSLYDLIMRLKNSYDEVFTYMGIVFKTDNLEKLTDMKLSMEYRQNLYLIFKEGINNCIKHSKCHKIILAANVKGNVIQMSLTDDGLGLIEKSGRRGNGLVNIKTRAKIIGGKVYWHSIPNEGTTVNFIGRIEKKIGLRAILRNALEPLLIYSK